MRRPTPEEVTRIAQTIAVNGEIAKAVLVESIRERLGCSRATAYRAVYDALAARAIQRAAASEAAEDARVDERG